MIRQDGILYQQYLLDVTYQYWAEIKSAKDVASISAKWSYKSIFKKEFIGRFPTPCY